MTPMEVCDGLGLYDLKNRIWHIQGTCALKGDGLYEGSVWPYVYHDRLMRFVERPQIYVVDSLDRERIGKAKAEFQAIINDPFMLNSVILVFANKQDMVSYVAPLLREKGAMTPMEVCDGLGLYDLKNRIWHIQGTCALKGDGLYEGLDWLASTLKELQATGRATSIGTSTF
ncbi:hypothetical protein M5K25_016994 [Dendrobium thyrsiflorum]|uniref:ADP-ribosylation factor n=1 Tax=Dendrobium thyrsiflorum TaxID=117978 RepID=A0ABD0ULA7_DENTH